MTPSVGAKALIPNPRLRPLEFLVGEWATTGTHPMLDGPPLTGLCSFSWHAAGAFLEMRTQVEHPRIPDGLAYIGSDDRAGTFSMIYVDEREVSRIYTVEVGEGSVTWFRDDPELAQSMTVTLQPDGTLVSEGRMSQNRGPWEADLSSIYRRV